MGIGSLIEGPARERLPMKRAWGLRPGAYGTATRTEASFGPGSFPPPRPASTRSRRLS